MEDSDMEVFQEFLHSNDADDYDEEDYSRPEVSIGDGPPSERVRGRREHQTSTQSHYLHLKVNNNIK
jgi:hypothetical protein